MYAPTRASGPVPKFHRTMTRCWPRSSRLRRPAAMLRVNLHEPSGAHRSLVSTRTSTCLLPHFVNQTFSLQIRRRRILPNTRGPHAGRPMGDDRVALLLGAVFAAERRNRETDSAPRLCPVWLAKPADTKGQRRGVVGRMGASGLTRSSTRSSNGRTAADVPPWARGRTPGRGRSPIAGRRSPPSRGAIASRGYDDREVIEIDGVRRWGLTSRATDTTVRCRCTGRSDRIHPAATFRRTRREPTLRKGGARCARCPGTVISGAVSLRAGQDGVRGRCADGGGGDEDGTQDHCGARVDGGRGALQGRVTSRPGRPVGELCDDYR